MMLREKPEKKQRIQPDDAELQAAFENREFAHFARLMGQSDLGVAQEFTRKARVKAVERLNPFK